MYRSASRTPSLRTLHASLPGSPQVVAIGLCVSQVRARIFLVLRTPIFCVLLCRAKIEQESKEEYPPLTLCSSHREATSIPLGVAFRLLILLI